MSDKDIVVGVDFSESSKIAIKEAAKIAASRGSWLNVVHIVDAEFFRGELTEGLLSEGLLKEKAFEALSKFTMKLLEGHPSFRLHVFVGHPFYNLIDQVEDMDADLLVIGSYGFGGNPDRAGTLASRCVRSAKVPVLLVREGKGTDFQNIVACCDFSEPSKKAANYAAELAVTHGSQLHLLTVHAPYVSYFHGIYSGLPDLSSEFQLQHIKNLNSSLEGELSALKENHPDLNAKAIAIQSSSISAGILDYLKEAKADVAVIGTTGKSGVKTFFLGSTAERLIHKSPCSVMSVNGEVDD